MSFKSPASLSPTARWPSQHIVQLLLTQNDNDIEVIKLFFGAATTTTVG
jgi:hypothetical protein